MLFFFIIFNGCSSEWLAIIVQVISWIIELDFQGGRRTINFVMFVFNVFDYSINFPTFVNNYSQFSISGICTAKGYAVSNMIVRQSEIIIENGQLTEHCDCCYDFLFHVHTSFVLLTRD